MKIEGQWIPESEEEVELIKSLHAVKVASYERGVDIEDIATAFAYMASATLAQPPEDKEGRELEDVVDEEREERFCPRCDEEIGNVRFLGIGGKFSLSPCGCVFEWEERDKFGALIQPPNNDEDN